MLVGGGRMSIVADQIRKVDAQLDRVQLAPFPFPADENLVSAQHAKVASSSRIAELQALVKALSTTSNSSPLLSGAKISRLLEQADLKGSVQAEEIEDEDEDEDEDDDEDEERGYRNGRAGVNAYLKNYEMELEWLLVSKATVQTYGLILNTLLEQTIPLSDDIWYWDEVLGSYTYSGLYTIQTSPQRLWDWGKDIYSDSRERLVHLKEAPGSAVRKGGRDVRAGVAGQWSMFYGLVRESIRERSVVEVQKRVMSPVALGRSKAKMNQARLKRIREMGASGLGVLMDEALSFDIDEEGAGLKAEESENSEWKDVVERSVALMDNVLRNVTALEQGVSDFEDTVFASVEDDPEISSADSSQATRTSKVSRRLQHILSTHVPKHITNSQKLVSEYGRPSRLVRYWLPASMLLLSSSTILRILVNRKAEVLTWIRELGSTIQDFWMNWVVDPTLKVIGTIRHDKDSEVAIMSKESLKGDMESLERMVVDFARDNPEAANYGAGALNDSQITEIKAKVKAGDLTPVLRAYEKDMQRPFVGTVRGDLIRTVLIQVQKTKVDVEVALSGIDALLKSQELVFGFLGLTPGVLVCFATFRYFGTLLGSRKGLRRGERAGRTARVLRNIDRILTIATPTQNNLLSYKDHGLLLCEVHVLRERAHSLFPGDVEREFLEDVGDLCNINSGIQVQLKVLERIRWSYGRWLR
ncbi:Bcnca2 [Botrytis cinerea B05.10]|uniref:Bcnca2 n=1 Tax=Botryotinia fuckeliana (strain B05.10) TaxID=332648 RepID=A0A384J3Z5_BOTFB|nr:Bcnca2 [Botrytis cinerea B05.10]ATZ45235.1 Bcnca2 [Botrytis cinerea B05.10]